MPVSDPERLYCQVEDADTGLLGPEITWRSRPPDEVVAILVSEAARLVLQDEAKDAYEGLQDDSVVHQTIAALESGYNIFCDYETGKNHRSTRTLYTDVVQIGQGTFGVAFTCRRDSIEKVIKCVDRRKLLREALNFCYIKPHVNVCWLRGVFLGRYHGVLEFSKISEITLRDLINAGTLNPSQVRKIILTAANGLAHIHGTNASHRDIKPGNIAVYNDDTALIIDLGNLAALEETRSRNRGTEMYSAPEMMRDDQDIPVTPSVDVFSLALTASEGLMGVTAAQMVFSGEFTTAPLRGMHTRYMNMLIHKPVELLQKLRQAINDRIQARFGDSNADVNCLRKFILSALKFNPKERPTALAASDMLFMEADLPRTD